MSCVCGGHTAELCNNGWTDRGAPLGETFILNGSSYAHWKGVHFLVGHLLAHCRAFSVLPSVLTLLVGRQEGYPACKKLSGWVLAWLSTYLSGARCRWPSRCHCHSLSLASAKSRLALPKMNGYRFTHLVPAHPGSAGQRAVKRVCVCVAGHCNVCGSDAAINQIILVTCFR